MPGANVDLSKVWLFSECSRSELRSIQKKTEQVAFAAGSVICDEGDVGQTFYYIISGRAAVLRNGRKTAELQDGGYFGELALLDRLPRSATVRALTDMELLAIDQREFNQLLKASPTTVRKLLVATAARLRSSDTKAILASVH